MKQLLVLSLFSVIVLSSCDHLFGKRIHGNGNIKTETRTAGQFNSIDVSGAIDVYVKQDSVYSIKVEADENLLEFIQVTDEGAMLHIRPAEGYNLDPAKGIKVYVSSPSFKNFEASGACNIYGESLINAAEMLSFDISGSSDVQMDVKTPKAEAELSGACTIQLKGETKEFTIHGSGSTDIKCMELMAENVHVDISGAGSAEVYASVKLDVEVSGAGDVKYKGNAAVSQSISGAGTVKKVE